MNQKKASRLINKYGNGSISDDEKEQLMQWYRQVADMEAIYPDDEDQTRERMFLRLNNYIVDGKNPNTKLRWMIAAAIILVVATAGIYFLFQPIGKKPLSVKTLYKPNPIIPGSNKAVLTLASGQKINLNNAKVGKLAIQGNVAIVKTGDGQVSYNDGYHHDNSSTVSLNTITTPKGGQYQLILPDGSHVWLNAASSITYPTTFNGNFREVMLTGEAYFEIERNPKKPFRVNVDKKQQVEVLGTHFNIEAYEDNDNIKTTLLKGSVKVTAENQGVLLLPGETAVYRSQKPISIQKADVEEVMAWKKGLFIFKDQQITDIMKKVARWYDVDVSYGSNVSHKRFGGTISRYKSIDELLYNISITGRVHYKIEGRKVMLMN